MKHVFIINPVAGKGRFQKELVRTITAVCGSKDLDWEIYETRSIGDALFFTRDYPGNKKVRFYAVGGDGTLNEVVNGAANRGNAEVGLFPCGSGNDFVRIFKNPERFLEVEAQIKGVPHPVDLIKCQGNYSINMCNMGLDAQTAADVHRYTRFMPGSMAYTVSLLNRVFHKMGFNITVTLKDGEIISGRCILATFANGVAYGGGYYSSPKAKYNDGLMDICLIKPVSRLKIATLLKVYKNGGHLDDHRLKDILIYRRSNWAKIETEAPQKLCIDGEILSVKTTELELIPKAVNFVVPMGLSYI
ncbi:MAG: diacylglycerol kinase family lipid kinase [Bacillota bacterium]|nr:diacylglycerol kinase family lipid kinase [Bacillota bacterium]